MFENWVNKVKSVLGWNKSANNNMTVDAETTTTIPPKSAKTILPKKAKLAVGKGKRYPATTKKLVIDLYKSGKTQAWITNHTGIPDSTVSYILQTYKQGNDIPKEALPKLTKQKAREVYSYRGKGFTWDEISLKTGVAKELVGDIILGKKYGAWTADMVSDYKVGEGSTVTSRAVLRDGLFATKTS